MRSARAKAAQMQLSHRGGSTCSEDFSRSVLLILFAVMLPFGNVLFFAPLAKHVAVVFVHVVLGANIVTIRKIRNRWLEKGKLYVVWRYNRW